MAGGEAFAILVMLIATGAGIAFIDFIGRNMTDAGIERRRPVTTGDNTPWGDIVEIPAELKAAGGNRSRGEKAGKAARAQGRTSEGYRTARHRERL